MMNKFYSWSQSSCCTKRRENVRERRAVSCYSAASVSGYSACFTGGHHLASPLNRTEACSCLHVGIKELELLKVSPEVNLDQRRRVLFFLPFPAATAELALAGTIHHHLSILL